MASISLFVLGGVGVEIVGYLTESPAVLVEETMEVIGVAVMVWATYGALGGTTIEYSAHQDLEEGSAN